MDLRNCYYNSLELAKVHDIHSIAFPAISTGVYGYPMQEAAKIALTTINEWLQENEDYELQAILSCFSQQTYDCYQRVL